MTFTDLRGCRAAFYGKVESLLEHLRSCTEEQLLQHDSQGNTVSPNTRRSRFMHAYPLDSDQLSSRGHISRQHMILTLIHTEGGACLRCLPMIRLSMAVQVLHLAVLRQHYDTVQALIDFGYPLFCKNIRKWMPLDEAVSLRDRRMVKLLHAADIQQMKALHRAKRGALLQTMQDMDDFTFKVGIICMLQHCAGSWGCLCSAL